MEQGLFELLSLINSPELQAKLLWLKVPFLFITAFFVAIIIISMTRTPFFQLSFVGDTIEIATFRPFGFPKMKKRWQRIMRRLETGNATEYKLAIIEADAILDETLRLMRFKGENVDERLEQVTPLMVPNIDELRRAHQVRNSVVYDPDYRLPLAEAREVMLMYQRAFENLDLFR